MFFTAPQDGTYYVSAGAHAHFVGTYRLSVIHLTDVSVDLPAGPETTGRVMVDGSVLGEIEPPGDRDWFAVELEAGKTYQFDLKGRWKEAGTLLDPYLHGIYDADGSLIEGTTDDDLGWGPDSHVTFTPTDDGTYYVSVGGDGNHTSRYYSVSAATNRTGTYRLSVANVSDADEQTDGTATTGEVAVGGSVMGEIDYWGDRDWFAVTLVAGTVYRIDLAGARVDGSRLLIDPYLHGIYDADGNLISGTTNDLSVEEITDIFAAGPDTTGTVMVDGSVRGEIDYHGDRDWFAVTLEADTTYRIDLRGASGGTGTLLNPYLRGIYDADGNLIEGTTNDDGGWGYNSRVIFRATESGIHYVSAGTSYYYDKGTYKLSASIDTTGTVAVDGSARGEIEFAGDRDWFAVIQVAMISVVVVKTGSAPRPLSANGRGGGRRSWVRRGIQNATSSPSKRSSCPSWHERSVWRGSLSSS